MSGVPTPLGEGPLAVQARPPRCRWWWWCGRRIQGVGGYENREALDADGALKERLEAIRWQAGR